MARRSTLLILTCGILPLGLAAQNPVQIENAKAGTSNWQLTNPATNREIEGYASLTSVNIGGSISFSVSTTDSLFKIDIFRMGWYNGAGARLMTTVSNLTGVKRNTPSPDANGMVECNWPSSYTLTVPGDGSWVSGIYLSRLTGNTSGKQSWIIFVVRDDNRTSDLIFESSVTTFEAYNFWPGGAKGESLYDWAPGTNGPTGGGRAWKVSFNRPYVLGDSYDSSQPGAATGVGAGEFLTVEQPGPDQGYPIFAGGWEYNLLRWLEKNGYDVTYFTDVDLHENANILNNHSAYLSVGHNEYWSWQMRQNVTKALANGVNLGFFGSNTMYWQIRFETSPKTGAADRTIVCYKYDAPSQDPLYNSSNPSLATVRWREAPVNMPEAALIGAEYFGDPNEGDMIINNASHFLLNGSGLNNGDHLTGLSGYEVDGGGVDGAPSNLQYVISTPVGPFGEDYDNPPGLSCNVNKCNNDVTWYSAGHAFVFATGSPNWNWGLDNFNAPSMHGTDASTGVQTITANVLRAFIVPPQVANASLPAGTKGLAYGPLQLIVTGGGPPYTFSATGLPSGMQLSSSGVLSGTPSVSGNFNPSFTVTDNASTVGPAIAVPLVINPGTSTFSISGTITLSNGSGLGGVTVTLNTGPSTTTNTSGAYSLSGLSNGSYTVTPSLSGYTFTPPSQNNVTISNANVTGVNFTASVSTATARAVSINFGADQKNGSLASGTSAGVVAKTNWNNITGNVSSSPVALHDETGATNGATVTWTSDNTWAVPISSTTNGNIMMMTGYLDTGLENTSTVTVAGLPSSSTGYDIYVYTDGDNAGSTDTGTYQIIVNGSTVGSIKATDPGNSNFNGTFTQANNSNGNYVKFSAIQTTGFTIKAIPTTAADGDLRAPLNGIQIVPTPATTARAVSINFGADQKNGSLASGTSAGVVAKSFWNNITGNVSSSPVSLVDETGAANGATVSWTSDNTWAVPISSTTNGNIMMMTGYLDTGLENTTTVTVAGLPSSSTGYDIYVYTDGDNAGSTDTGTYQIIVNGSTVGSIAATDPGNSNFNGTFTQANNSNGNYVKFTSIQTTGFMIKAIPTTAADGDLRAPLNGIQIIPH